MAKVGIGFNISASAAGMAAGINAGVVELQKLGFAAKQTSRDVATLKAIELSRNFIGSVRFVARTFQQFTAGAAQAIDSTAKLSRSLGLTFAELNQLQLAADLAGVSSERLARSFTRAQVTITEAEQGSQTAVDALDTLGLSVANLAGRSTNQQFIAIAEAINGIEDPTRRAAAAVDVFGRSGADLLPLFAGVTDQLRSASEFAERFSLNLTDQQAKSVEAVNDAFRLVSLSVQSLTGRVIAELSPALVSAAFDLAEFAKTLNVQDVARAAEAAISDISAILRFLGGVVRPLAENLLPTIATAFAFLARGTIISAIGSIPAIFSAAAAAAAAFASATTAAAAATTGLTFAVRALTSSTGLGIIITLAGLVAGSFLQWSNSAEAAGDNTAEALERTKQEIRDLQAGFRDARLEVTQFGEDLEKAFLVPERVFDADIATDLLKNVQGQFTALARELGSTAAIPAKLADQYTILRTTIRTLNSQVARNAITQEEAARRIIELQNDLTESINRTRDARKAEVDALAAAQSRLEELTRPQLSDADQDRIRIEEDLLLIARERARVQQNLSSADFGGIPLEDIPFDFAADLIALRDAEARLRQELAGLNQDLANQERELELDIRGIDANIFEIPPTLESRIIAVGRAFGDGVITELERDNALVNLAAEGRSLLEQAGRELSAVNTQPLQVQDLRTSEGISSFLALATGRQDPEARDRAQQLQKLEQIRRAILDAGADPVDILGG